MAMRKELRGKIVASNKERNAISEELAKYGMRIVESAIFKGSIPNAIYLGRLSDYKEVINKYK